ncbi:hypothetical protein ACQVRX_11385 [Ralstonia pseudosolanacearum]
MPRKPVQLEQTGGKSPRQRVWEAIRARRAGFTRDQLAGACRGLETNVTDYVTVLLKAGIIEVVAEEAVNQGGIRPRLTYRLVRDNGVEAPRVNRQGNVVSQGAGTEAMWQTMHRMFEKTAFDARELAAFASSKAHTVAEGTAKAYVAALHKAGYLRLVESARLGKNPRAARYVLIANRYTGPRAPMIQRARTVYDPNEGRVVFVDEEEIVNAL